MNNSKEKLRKALGLEVTEHFEGYANGQLQKTKDEIAEYMDELESMDLEDIRIKKCELRDELDELCDE